jgi:serine/threonine-protein kinase RsbW
MSVRIDTTTEAPSPPPLSPHPPRIPMRVVLEKVIPSDAALITPLILRTVAFLLRERLIEPELQEKMQICLVEALRNAVTHGNRNDFSKRVRLRVLLDDVDWGLLVEDQGAGFDPAGVFKADEADSLWGERGRGILIMRHYMDCLEYYSGGRALLLTRKRHRGAH